MGFGHSSSSFHKLQYVAVLLLTAPWKGFAIQKNYPFSTLFRENGNLQPPGEALHLLLDLTNGVFPRLLAGWFIRVGGRDWLPHVLPLVRWAGSSFLYTCEEAIQFRLSVR